jgi:hypothetical protein
MRRESFMRSIPILRRITDRPDESILGAILLFVVGLTAVTLTFDLSEQIEVARANANARFPDELAKRVPFLPSIRTDVAPDERDQPGRPGDSSELQKPMAIELLSGGRLQLTGVITPGTASRFSRELERRSEYVTTVVLDSPGGSVMDALEMARLIHDHGFDTYVAHGGLCASSCPLVFAGGIERIAEPGAAIGVHQVTAITQTQTAGLSLRNPGFDMIEAQRASALCQRLLLDMGIDARAWVHAMETPPDKIFYFTDDELLQYKIATRIGAGEESR